MNSSGQAFAIRMLMHPGVPHPRNSAGPGDVEVHGPLRARRAKRLFSISYLHIQRECMRRFAGILEGRIQPVEEREWKLLALDSDLTYEKRVNTARVSEE